VSDAGEIREVVIAGAGVTGLSAALFLEAAARAARRSVRITVLEASHRTGGAIATRTEGGFLMEEGADSLVRVKPAAIELCNELGLAGELLPTRPGPARTLIVRNGRLMPLPMGFHLFAPSSLRPLATAPVFSWPGKLRMSMDLFLPRRRRSPGEDESLGSFVRRRLGREALERLAQPMVAGIWSGDPDDLSLRATMPQWLEMEDRHRSVILALRAQIRQSRQPDRAAGARYSLFVTLRRGLGHLADTLRERLPAGALRTGVRVVGLDRRGTRWRVATSEGTRTADAVILALPVGETAALLRTVDEPLCREVAAIPTSSCATINLVYRTADLPRPLDGYGFVCPQVEGRSLLACTFSSRKYEGRCDDAWSILRGYVQDGLDRPEQDVIATVRSDLKDLMGLTAEPVVARFARWDGVFPQYRTGHLDRVDRIERLASALPGFALAGNAYRGVGISDCVESARRASREVIAALATVPVG